MINWYDKSVKPQKEAEEQVEYILNQERDIAVIDMSNYLYKFYFVNKSLSIKKEDKEIPTGHIYGFLNFIANLKNSLFSPVIIIAVDGYDKERVELNPAYKKGRKHEFDIHADTPNIIEMTGLLDDVYISYNPNYEADDTIASITHYLNSNLEKQNSNIDINILSADKDLYQSVLTDNIKISKNMKEFKNRQDVTEEMKGVLPENLAKYKALTGDISDCIRGYYRFPKELAAFLANNAFFANDIEKEKFCQFEHDGNNTVLDKKDNKVNFKKSWWKFIDKIEENYELFYVNYKIIAPKLYPFNLFKPNTEKAYDLIEYYQLERFKKQIC